MALLGDPAKGKKKFQKEDLLKNADPTHFFFLADGTIIKNIKELIFMLDDLPEWVFKHHVNDQKNDFASWIRNVLGDQNLAEKISGVKSSEEMKKIIIRHVLKLL